MRSPLLLLVLTAIGAEEVIEMMTATATMTARVNEKVNLMAACLLNNLKGRNVRCLGERELGGGAG